MNNRVVHMTRQVPSRFLETAELQHSELVCWRSHSLGKNASATYVSSDKMMTTHGWAVTSSVLVRASDLPFGCRDRGWDGICRCRSRRGCNPSRAFEVFTYAQCCCRRHRAGNTGRLCNRIGVALALPVTSHSHAYVARRYIFSLPRMWLNAYMDSAQM